jgi:hypothetical protein
MNERQELFKPEKHTKCSALRLDENGMQCNSEEVEALQAPGSGLKL